MKYTEKKGEMNGQKMTYVGMRSKKEALKKAISKLKKK